MMYQSDAGSMGIFPRWTNELSAHQRGGAGGVHADGGPRMSKSVGEPSGRHAGGPASDSVRARPLQAVRSRPIRRVDANKGPDHPEL
eukprot:754647-Prorocentrum_minimum.AAC.1